MAKFYLAASLKNMDMAQRVAAACIARGHEQTYDWTTHGPVQGQGNSIILNVCLAEMDGVARADVVIVLLSVGHLQRGTHVEMGMALALRKSIIILADDPQVLTNDQMEVSTCAFYYAPGIYLATHESSIPSWLDELATRPGLDNDRASQWTNAFKLVQGAVAAEADRKGWWDEFLSRPLHDQGRSRGGLPYLCGEALMAEAAAAAGNLDAQRAALIQAIRQAIYAAVGRIVEQRQEVLKGSMRRAPNAK